MDMSESAYHVHLELRRDSKPHYRKATSHHAESDVERILSRRCARRYCIVSDCKDQGQPHLDYRHLSMGSQPSTERDAIMMQDNPDAVHCSAAASLNASVCVQFKTCCVCFASRAVTESSKL